MKKILILLLFSFSLQCFAQIDSSKTKVSINLAAKTCEYIIQYFENTNKFEDIDSVLKKRFRVQSPPTNNNNVQIDSIEGKVLMSIYTRLTQDPIALSDTTKHLKRFSEALRQTGSSWLNSRIDRTQKDKSDQDDQLRTLGRSYLLKQEN